MSLEDITTETKVAIYDATHTLLIKFVGQRGHSACWLYPNLLFDIANLHGLRFQEPTIPREVFENGCRITQATIYGERQETNPSKADITCDNLKFDKNKDAKGQLYFNYGQF